MVTSVRVTTLLGSFWCNIEASLKRQGLKNVQVELLAGASTMSMLSTNALTNCSQKNPKHALCRLWFQEGIHFYYSGYLAGLGVVMLWFYSGQSSKMDEDDSSLQAAGG